MDSADSSRVAELWERLAPHVEWPEGLSLVFLFAGHPGPVRDLRERFESSLRERGKSSLVLEPMTTEAVVELTPVLVREPEENCGGAWVSLLGRAGSHGWADAMRELLYRLNERRFLLETKLAVPLVIVLPLELRGRVYEIAPDLWTVRSFVDEVPEIEVARRSKHADNRGASVGQQIIVHGNTSFGPMDVAERTLQEPRTAASDDDGPPPSPAEREWARLLESRRPQLLAAADGFAAYDAALERGDLETARQVAAETVMAVSSRAGVEVEDPRAADLDSVLAQADPRTPGVQRDLATSLERLGYVEMLLGNRPRARQVLERALELRDELVRANPQDVDARREAIASLHRCGDLEVWAGDTAEARDLFKHALDLAEELRDSGSNDRDLSVALDKLGGVEVQAGNLAAARDLFQRSLHAREGLAKADPHSALAVRDLSVSLDNLGNLEVQAGNLAAARDLFQRSLQLSEGLAKADPHSALASRDLCVSLNNLGEVEMQSGNLARARELIERALSAEEVRMASDEHNARASLDVAESLDRLARIELQQGKTEVALRLLQRAREILDGMANNGWLAGFAEGEQLRDGVTQRLAALQPATS